jgi:broad specificity phosphatase PhoE
VSGLLLVRHGETDYNADPARIMGGRDEPLNARGRAQAGELAERLSGEGVVALWSSHLSRALETAEIVGCVLGLTPHPDARLAESRRGAWEGRLVSDIEREEPDAWAAYRRAGATFRFPATAGGPPAESLREHQERVLAALAEVRAGPLPALVVCHGGTIRVALAAERESGLARINEVAVPNGAVVRLGV